MMMIIVEYLFLINLYDTINDYDVDDYDYFEDDYNDYDYYDDDYDYDYDYDCCYVDDDDDYYDYYNKCIIKSLWIILNV